MGNILGTIAPNSRLSQQFPPSPAFDPDRDIPDLTGKVAIVTGGNTGIGWHTVKHLLLKNATVYLAARTPNSARCIDAVKQLKADTTREPVVLELDLADLHSVRKAAEAFLKREQRLDMLFNSAGVMAPPLDQLTAQGYDLQFGTNVIGHYLFTILLLPALASSTEYHGTKARVIHTSSVGQEMAPRPTGLDWRTMKGGTERDQAIKGYGSSMATWKLYGASKLGNVLVSKIFTQYHSDVVASCSLHPGGLMSDLYRHMPNWQQWLVSWVLYPPHMGALTQLWAGTAVEAEGISGKYLVPWARIGKAVPQAYNEETRDTLKAWLEEELNGY